MTTDGGERARVFAALALGEELGRALAGRVDAALQAAGVERDALRRPRPEGLHLTLFFIGDVERGRTAALLEALAGGLGGAPAPQLVLTGGGGFPSAGKARVLWAGVREEAGSDGRLAGLFERTREALAAAGVAAAAEPARPFRPHVTVGRPRGRTTLTLPQAFRELEVGLAWSPLEAVLLESCRGDGPPRYVPLGTIPLGPAPL